MMGRLWLDMDGVLADLERGYREMTGLDGSKELDSIDWGLVRGAPGFFADLPPMPDLDELWEGVRHLDPCVLTGVPAAIAAEAAYNKRQWIDRRLGQHVRAAFCRSVDKWKFCGPGDVLVDDWEKHRALWVGAGGTWVTHASAASTLAALRSLGVL